MGIYICSCPDNGNVLIQAPHLSGWERWHICFSHFQLLFLHVCLHSSWFVKAAAHVNTFSSAREFQVQNVHPFLKELVSHSFLHRQVLPASHAGTGSEVSPGLELSCSLEYRGWDSRDHSQRGGAECGLKGWTLKWCGRGVWLLSLLWVCRQNHFIFPSLCCLFLFFICKGKDKTSLSLRPF